MVKNISIDSQHIHKTHCTILAYQVLALASEAARVEAF